MLMASENLVDDEHNIETLLAKATNPLHRHPDPESLAAFCEFVDKERDGSQTALRLLAHKIQSPIEKESLMALAVLEESVKTCGSKLKSEVGKFRFLNEMIKVVSPKYLGNRASPKVKQKIVELMYLWSVELKQETKIFEAYQMLRRQGVVMEDPVYVIEDYEPPPPPAPRPKNAIFDDEEKAKLVKIVAELYRKEVVDGVLKSITYPFVNLAMLKNLGYQNFNDQLQLQQLLSSNRPEDLQAANRMIKGMVKEADRRMELLAKRSTELETVHNNAKVLADMLDHYSGTGTSAEEKELMKELFESCERLRPKLFRLAGEMDEKDEGLCDILKANDELTIVISRYRKVMGISEASSNSAAQASEFNKNGAALLDLASPVEPSASPPADSSLLDDQLLVLGLNDPVELNKKSVSSSTNSRSDLSDLDQIFAIGHKPLSTQPMFSKLPPSLNSSLVSSLPINVSSGDSVFTSTKSLNSDYSEVSLKPQTYSSSSKANSTLQAKNPPSNSVLKGLEELDELGQSMLRESMPSISAVRVEIPSTPQKIPLSQLKQQKEEEKLQQQSNSLPSYNEATSEGNLAHVGVACSNPALNSIFSERAPTPQSPSHEVLSLADVFVPLETIQPGSLPPLTLLEKNGLTVVIHFGLNTPRADVSVMVVSTMSKNSSPVKSVSFQAAVPKTMKIKLQPPSATDLPPHNPILPPAAITQVLLLANPLKEKVRFKYKVNYNLNNQDYTDIGDVDDLFSVR